MTTANGNGYLNLGGREILNTTAVREFLNPDAIQGRLREIGDVAIELWEEGDRTEEVEHFKYKQELARKMTVSSMIGLGFSLMAVPFGVSTTLSIGLIDGGPVTILWGWVTVTFCSIFVALSLAEITSKFPSSGGVYHFSAVLANEKYSQISSWFTGWFLILGNWTMFVSITFGGSQFILSIFGLKKADYKHDDFIVLIVYYVLVFFCALVNLKFQKHLERINKLCIYWTIYTVLIMDILLLLFSSSFHDLKYILTQFNASRSGWPGPIAFMVGLQSAAFTLQGYGMIPAMCDEVKNPERNVPKGMIFAVMIAGATGVIFIIPILSILPELTQLLDDNPDIFPIDIVFKISTKSFLVSFFLVLLLIGSVLFAGIGSLTTASRGTYAFSRDGALPFKNYWEHVDKTEDQELVPKNATYLCVAVALILGLLSLLSSAAFNAFVGGTVISLSIANGIPILALLLNKRKKIKGAAFKLRKVGYIVNILSLIWIVLQVMILCMPPSRYVTIKTMNYAVAVFVFFFVFTAISYLAYGRTHFTGPEIDTNYVAVNPISDSDRPEDVNNTENGYSENPDSDLFELEDDVSYVHHFNSTKSGLGTSSSSEFLDHANDGETLFEVTDQISSDHKCNQSSRAVTPANGSLGISPPYEK